VALGCSIELKAVLDFSDALVFLICVPNIIGLYMLAPLVQKELKRYDSKFRKDNSQAPQR
jgi:AGCS family alanine or glycine:cation symporter